MKSEKNNKPDLDDQAAEWVLKNDRGLSAAEQDAFTDWLSQSPEHREAYATHRFSWAELSRLAGLQNTDYAPIVPDLLGIDNSPWYRKVTQFPAIAAGISIAALLIASIGFVLLNRPADQQQVTITDSTRVLNHISQKTLDDGSVVDLNKGAVIETYYTRDARLIKLISGEANFTVKKDASRPFIVEASGVRLRALGTIFNVRMGQMLIDVVVTEGTVAIRHPELTADNQRPSAEESLIRTNFRAIVDLKPEIPQVAINSVNEAELDNEFLWHPRLIDFENASLTEIVNEFNRRNPVKIVIEDEQLGSLKFTSIFWSHNVESFVRLLEANYGISAEFISENQISLRKSPAAL